jgi:hypothetical protein
MKVAYGSGRAGAWGTAMPSAPPQPHRPHPTPPPPPNPTASTPPPAPRPPGTAPGTSPALHVARQRGCRRQGRPAAPGRGRAPAAATARAAAKSAAPPPPAAQHMVPRRRDGCAISTSSPIQPAPASPRSRHPGPPARRAPDPAPRVEAPRLACSSRRQRDGAPALAPVWPPSRLAFPGERGPASAPIASQSRDRNPRGQHAGRGGRGGARARGPQPQPRRGARGRGCWCGAAPAAPRPLLQPPRRAPDRAAPRVCQASVPAAAIGEP